MSFFVPNPASLLLRWVVLVFLVSNTLCPALASAEQRFRDLVFEEVDVVSNIPFGIGQRDEGIDQPLLMDIYAPRGDTLMRRPVIVLAFPGGFTNGARDDPEMVVMATRFAQHGYVAASIDYRLIRGFPSSTAELEVSVLRAVHDMRAAVRFFREDAAGNNVYGTDGVNVFVGGISAGAVMAANVGVLDEGDEVGGNIAAFLAANGGIAGNSSTNTEFSSAASGVLQISGATAELDWIDPSTPPIYAAHEEFDPIVPCPTSFGGGFVLFGLALRSSGGCVMIPRARDVGVPTEFFFDEGSFNHIGYNEEAFLQILDDSAAFFYREVLRPAVLASALLPSSRSIQVGELGTVFASVVNGTTQDVANCTVVAMTDLPASFAFRTTDAQNAPVGEANEPFSIAAGSSQSLVLEFAATDDFPVTDVFFRYECADVRAADNTVGLNSLVLSGNDASTADIIGLTTVVDLAVEQGSTAVFAVGSANVGFDDVIGVTVDSGDVELPLLLELCRTDSETGVCLEDPVPVSTLSYPAGSTASFAVFVTAIQPIANDPARNRIFVRFTDAAGDLRGATSTAVRAQ